MEYVCLDMMVYVIVVYGICIIIPPLIKLRCNLDSCRPKYCLPKASRYLEVTRFIVISRTSAHGTVDSLDSGNINLSKSQRADLLQKIHVRRQVFLRWILTHLLEE